LENSAARSASSSRMTADLALQALLAAVWRRKPKAKVMIHSDQGSQFISKEWLSFLGKHNLVAVWAGRARLQRDILKPKSLAH
jgi:transposase InsO family protein